MSTTRSSEEEKINSHYYDAIFEYKKDILDDDHAQFFRELESTKEEGFYHNIDYKYKDFIRNERMLLLPNGGDTSSNEGTLPDQEEEHIQGYLDYRQKNRFIILILVIFIPAGVKFFKAAQSSFEEYLMNDPKILMSATTYSLAVSLMTLPAATLLGGALLDYRGKREKTDFKRQYDTNRIKSCFQFSKQQSYLKTSRIPSYSANLFIGISLLGIMIYGYGLEKLHSIPVGLFGATIFGLGEGSVVVAAHTFLSHVFHGCDGVIAQGVLMAMNNLSMIASKIFIPWLIENEKTKHNQDLTLNYLNEGDDMESDDNNLWIGMVACCLVQLFSLSAGILYAWWFGLTPLQQSHEIEVPQEPDHHSNEHPPSKKNKSLSSESCLPFYFTKLPITFWIIAIGHAIFVVVFKIFTRNSNSFLIEKFGMNPISAGIKSSFHESFALGSPVVGYLAYRSPGGIVPVLLFGAALGSISIGTLACFPAHTIRDYVPGGAVTPILGISIAHGIFIPICMAIIPQTCSPDQTGMAYAVVEVLSSIFNLVNILFGWLRDTTGSYKVPMEMLLLYSLIGLYLLYISRNHIKLIVPNE